MKRKMIRTEAACLPHTAPHSNRIAADRKPPAATGGRRIRVVVVEDDDWLRAHLAEDLGAAPDLVFVNSYSNGESALKGIPGDSADVVLMDIGMPGMGGVQCVRSLKELLPNLQVLMLTVYAGSDQVFAALLAGADGYLLKRSSSEELLDAIRKVQHGESPMDWRIARQVVQYFGQMGKAKSSLQVLTAREKDVLERLAKGAAYKEIAEQLNMAMGTVISHVKSIYQKLHVHSRGEAAAIYFRE